jgi:hypothetical protein
MSRLVQLAFLVWQAADAAILAALLLSLVLF